MAKPRETFYLKILYASTLYAVSYLSYFLRWTMTRISPLGCITPTPILSTKNVGRSADVGSASIVYFIKRRTSSAFNSFRAKCLHGNQKKAVNNTKMPGVHPK